jgi:hypothetical protein
MAATTTTANGAISASSNVVTLTAYTAPAGRAKPILKVDDEIMLITDTSASPTLGVVRGYMGTSAVQHRTQAAIVYGAPQDMQVSKGPSWTSASLVTPAILGLSQEVTCTGTTGTNAANITATSAAFLNVTGTSGAGINLPYPLAGASYVIKNGTTGALLVYSDGASLNGVTGTTGVTIGATGNRLAFANCATAGAWQINGNT